MLPRARQIFVLILLVLLAGATSALAEGFAAMPGANASQKDLQLKMVKYEGSTNGVMVIQVKNTGKISRKFDASGLFFVPKGDPEKAPQRLGASGPFTEIAKSASIVHQEGMLVPAGATKTVELEVFCIDSHRSSPSSSTKFAIAKNTLPTSLQRDMKRSISPIYKQNKGDLRKAKSAVQSSVWQTRDKDWVELEGERANEKAPKSRPQQRRRMRPQRKN